MSTEDGGGVNRRRQSAGMNGRVGVCVYDRRTGSAVW